VTKGIRHSLKIADRRHTPGGGSPCMYRVSVDAALVRELRDGDSLFGHNPEQVAHDHRDAIWQRQRPEPLKSPPMGHHTTITASIAPISTI